MFDFEAMLIRVPGILLALTFHEFAHGWMARKLGDDTAELEGRLTLNPLAHLDPMGTIMLLFAPIGWAKPVPVNSRNFREPRRDILLVSLAGPMSNVILAVILGYAHRFIALQSGAGYVFEMLTIGIWINIGISLFNLMPIPPLDGSKILMGLLKPEQVPAYLKIMRYAPQVFLVLLFAEFYLGIRTWSLVFYPLLDLYKLPIFAIINLGA
ncbi:MAG: site-2 protease family protein [Chitinivibrionales bacterium]|nr:site-2 protease family protein [Chitinivibrionales bacterium]